MSKTLHQKLAVKTITTPAEHQHVPGFNSPIATNRLEHRIKEQLRNELLSPRPEAIDRLLALSRAL